MSVLVVIVPVGGVLKNAAYEVLSYGAAIAKERNISLVGLVIGKTSDDLSQLGKYGVDKILYAEDEKLSVLDAKNYASLIMEAIDTTKSEIIVFSNGPMAKNVAPYLAARLKAGLVMSAIGLPTIQAKGFVVRKTVFGGKATADIAITTPLKIIALQPNSYKVVQTEGLTAVVEPISVVLSASSIKVLWVEQPSGKVALPEASVVVSGGRGMKGPENWGMIEDLATSLDAATACSRPVSDDHWRPHHEHVGQTGIQIAPNLYIAIGISGAIQHLAGVNRSKHIVVINKDPEAPFFKAADYGIVGDAFEIVPKLTEAIKNIRNQ